MLNEILREVAHRPWPLPAGPWVMTQSWHDLLFAHWPVDAAKLRAQIPERLEIDMFEGNAWLAVVPFRMTGVRLRGTPAVPWLSAFPELNVRTYVVCDGKPGVWFFSPDAGNSLAVTIARAWFHLPYFRARMRCSEHNGWIEYVSRRNHSGAAPATVQVRYRPIAPAFLPQRGTLEHFLTERYCLYALDGSHRLKFGLFFWDQTWAGRFELINAWNDGPKNDPGSHNAEEHDLHSSECVVRNGLRANYVCDKKK